MLVPKVAILIFFSALSVLKGQTTLPLTPQAQSNIPTVVPSGGKIPLLSLKSVQFPNYPMIAKYARLESVVKTLVDIDYSGAVNNVVFTDGKKQLCATVLKAVSHWQFNEKLINQVPVEFHFILSPSFPDTAYRVTFEPSAIIVVIEAHISSEKAH